jgi:hypothetical protein
LNRLRFVGAVVSPSRIQRKPDRRERRRAYQAWPQRRACEEAPRSRPPDPLRGGGSSPLRAFWLARGLSPSNRARRIGRFEWLSHDDPGSPHRDVPHSVRTMASHRRRSRRSKRCIGRGGIRRALLGKRPRRNGAETTPMTTTPACASVGNDARAAVPLDLDDLRVKREREGPPLSCYRVPLTRALS